MNSYTPKTFFSKLLTASLSLMLSYFSGQSLAASAGIEKIRAIDEPEDLFGEEYYNAGDPKLSGMGFPPGAHTLLAFDGIGHGLPTSAVMDVWNLYRHRNC